MTGKFHGLSLGATLQEVKAVLGEPETYSITRRPDDPFISKYGRLQITFVEGLAENLYVNVRGYGQDPDFAADWPLAPFSRGEVESLLLDRELLWFEDHRPVTEEADLVLTSGVSAMFHEGQLFRWNMGTWEQKRVKLFQQFFGL